MTVCQKRFSFRVELSSSRLAMTARL